MLPQFFCGRFGLARGGLQMFDVPQFSVVREQLGPDVVTGVEASVRRACMASIVREANVGVLETLLVAMLASAISTHGGAEFQVDLAEDCSELLVKLVREAAKSPEMTRPEAPQHYRHQPAIN